MQTITASSGHPLIAGLPDGRLVADASLTGSWMPLGDGTRPGISRPTPGDGSNTGDR